MSEKLDRYFDEMCWPTPGERLNEIEWQLRYGDPAEIRLSAARIVAAYRRLVEMPERRRRYIIRELRKGPS